jgi:hypothetical protein
MALYFPPSCINPSCAELAPMNEPTTTPLLFIPRAKEEGDSSGSSRWICTVVSCAQGVATTKKQKRQLDNSSDSARSPMLTCVLEPRTPAVVKVFPTFQSLNPCFTGSPRRPQTVDRAHFRESFRTLNVARHYISQSHSEVQQWLVPTFMFVGLVNHEMRTPGSRPSWSVDVDRTARQQGSIPRFGE